MYRKMHLHSDTGRQMILLKVTNESMLKELQGVLANHLKDIQYISISNTQMKCFCIPFKRYTSVGLKVYKCASILTGGIWHYN